MLQAKEKGFPNMIARIEKLSLASLYADIIKVCHVSSVGL